MSWQSKQYESGLDDSRNEINPQQYAGQIVQSIILAPTKALESNKPFDDGLMAMTVNTEFLEILCRANGWICGEGDDYESNLREKINLIQSKLNLETVTVRRDAMISRIKFELLLKVILESRMQTAVLKA